MYAPHHVLKLICIAEKQLEHAKRHREDAAKWESEARRTRECADWINRALEKGDQALCAIAARACPPDAAPVFADVQESDEVKARAIQIMFAAIDRAEAKEATHAK
jgi:hypothetical protein